MDRQKNIYDLMQDARIALSGGEWPDFLRSAAWNFRFRFLAQTLIYAQRPDATACYTFDDWHKRFGRRIRRGAKGIALLDDRKDQLSLSHVFDYRDTYHPEGRELSSWQVTGEKEPAVREALLREFMVDVPGVDVETDASAFYGAAVESLLDDCMAQTFPDLQEVRSRSRLVRFSDARAEEIYRTLLRNSVTAMVMYRCGLEPAFTADAFASAAYFNTNETMSILGNAAQSLSSRILREIALTVAAWDKAHQHEEEKEHEDERNVSPVRGVSDPEPDHSTQPRAEQVRPDAPEIPEREQGEPVHVSPDERRADGASAPDGRDDEAAGRREDGVSPDAGSGAAEREGESSLGTAHGAAETPGGGDGPSGDDLSLNFFTTRDMESVLLSGPDIEGGKFRIQRAFEEKAPELQKLLSREYGQGGRSFLFEDGTEGQLSWNAKCLTLTAPGYNPWNLSWHMVHNRIRDLVDAGRYLDEQEKLQSERYFADQNALHSREELGVTLRVFFSIYGAKDHDSITRNEEDLRAFIYENSKVARTHLLATYGALVSHPTVLQDETALQTLTDLLNALGDDTRPEFTSQIPSATDLGIVNPFPTEAELERREQDRKQPLAREPLSEFPSADTVEVSPAAADPSQEIYGEGELVTISGTEYVLLEVADDFVVLQDAEHPLFTQELPFPVFRTLMANSAANSRQAEPLYSENIPETQSETTPVKDTDITEQPIESTEPPASEPAASLPDPQVEPVKEPEPQRRGINAARKSYRDLEAYAPYILDGTLDYVRFESDTYEPLYIERISDNEIAIAHTLEENGDLVVDPEMVFWVDEDAKALWPVSIEQPAFGGIIQRVYDYGDTKHQHPNTDLERDLTSFFRSWMQNLEWQDHQPVRGKKRSVDGDREYTFRDGQPVLKEPEPEMADTEGAAVLWELLDHYERWHGRDDIHVQGGYFDVINRRMQAMEPSDDAKTNRDNILYAGYVVRHFFPLPDMLSQRARDTSRILTRAENYLDIVSSLEDMGNVLRLSEWKEGCEHALFLDLCGLCSACPELPEDIRAIAKKGMTVELDGGQYQVVDLDLILLDNEPLANLRKVSGPSDLPEHTSEPLGYVDILMREQGAVDFYTAIPALANALQSAGRPAAVTEGLHHTYDQLIRAGLHYENDRYALYPERRQAEREQEGAKTPTVGELYDEFLPMVLSRVLKDRAYFNALQYADEENLKVECDAAVNRAVLSINDMQLLKLYYDMTSFHNRLHRDILTQSRQQAPQQNPEPVVDHPELRIERHFPASRADKEHLAGLLQFVTDYRSTFARQRGQLSEHDQAAYEEATEFLDTRVVTDSVYENLDNIRNVVNYVNAWYLPFSEGLNPEFVEATYTMLDRASQLKAEDLLRAESERGAASVSEAPAASEPASEPAVTAQAAAGQYDESSFHVGDYYEDVHSRGIITNVYLPDDGVPHEPSFSLTDPDAPEDSRDAKGYVVYMPVAIRRLNRGEASLQRAEERPEPVQSSADREEGELSLFDFQFDAPAVSEETPAEPAEPQPKPVVVQAAQGSVSQDERINFRLTGDTIPLGGPKARFQSNVAAIRLLKDLEREERLATPAEQEILSRYVGWGGISDAFDANKSSWSNEYRELKELLTEEEYEAARESTLTAFYTPPEVMDAVYQVLGNLGFQKGNILDPGCGTGGFSGRLPDEMSESRVYGIEKDSISGRIARQLYQKNNIAIEGYEDTKLPDNFFDVAVGNVPFGNFKVPDRRYDKLNLQIHDYFFAKTLDKVRPGGVIAFITSMGTMDKQNADFRRYLSQRADLLGAIRLPNNTFKTNAGTDVTSDIIFLQKRDFPRVEEAYWTDLDRSYDYETGVVGEEVNAYFANNPDMILGEMTEISGPHGPELACIARPGQDLKAELQRAVAQIQGAMEEQEQGLYDQEYEERESIPADPDVRNFSYTLVDDEIYFREDSEMFRVEVGKKGEERIRGLIELRDTVHALIDAQVEGYSDEAILALQRKLNDTYDAFTAKNGLINSRGNSQAFSDDSAYYLLCSLEHVNDKGEFLGKADMFYKRTIRAQEHVDHVETAQEALAVSLGERGRIDFALMSRLTGLEREDLIEQLRGQIFEDPTDPGHFELSAMYLSGNVREKLRQAKAAAEDDPARWGTNVRALEDVLPQDLEPADITARLGSTWIPAEDYTQFMYELFSTPQWYKDRGTMEVVYSPYTNIFTVKNADYDNWNTKANTTYGSRRMSGYKILEHTLNLKDVKVFDTVLGPDRTERRVLNEEETMVLQEKQQMIRDAFREWLWSDPDRTERLCRTYNDRFNSYVPPKFDGQLVRFHNMNPNVTMRPWQRDAVARIMYNGNTLLAHAVGAGKTWTMSAAAKEMKYLGLCNKSMIVVPNHLVGQWASAIYEQYPDAKILASTKKDFETKNRKKFCSRIATGDYDIVIIGHSQFERIPLSLERQEAGIRDEIRKVVDGISEVKAAKGENFTIKQMERMKKSLETRLEKLHNSKRRDDVITFEQLGVDRLFVDESHNYKNLFLFTKMQNVAGISQTDSQKASDMFLKCRYLDEITGNKGNIHATGTPLSNTMAELYATQRYLQHDLLEEMGLGTFDQWASTFGETVTSVELAPEGTGYRARTRFANFFNLPELMSLYCQVADIQTADMLDLPLPTPHYENVVVPASQIQKEYVQTLGDRAQKIRNGSVKPEEDNMLCVTNDGRKLALDQRLIDPDWPDDPGSKVNACADNILRIWTESAETKGTQLVFCDISTPTGKGFNVYDDLKEKLIARGIPADEIRFIHEANTDAQKEALFQKVRDGEVRVLMGSTGKMGTGTNVQDRLVAGHDLDCPWRPSDLEQRAGRVVRQGNSNKDVYMYRYVTEGTFDAYLYQLVENKQRFISQVYTSKPVARTASDVDEIVLSFAEIKALASGNPLIKERVELEADIQRLQLIKARHENAQIRLKHRATKDLPNWIASRRAAVAAFEKDAALIKSHPKRDAEGHYLPITVKGVTYDQSKEAGAAILKAITLAPKDKVVPIGSLRGFTLSVDNTANSWGKYSPSLVLTGPGTTHGVSPSESEIGTVTRLHNMLDDGIETSLALEKMRLSNLEQELASARDELGKPFTREKELAAKQARLAELTHLLDLDAQKAEQPGHEEPEREEESPAPQSTTSSLDSLISGAAARQAVQAAGRGEQAGPVFSRH